MRRIKRQLSRLANSILLMKRVVVFVVLLIFAISIYQLLLENIIKDSHTITSLLLLWLFSAYIFLPRVHRRLTKLYIPDYFIGRVRTGDGLLGDPVNIAINGTKEQLRSVMLAAGWTEAIPLSTSSGLRMIRATILKKSYRNAPVSSLFLFGQKQEIAFQIELNNNPHARHHVRFWKTPKDWYLPGGTKADWLGAATFDRRVGLSLFTGQFTHKIAENTDQERDFVAHSIAHSSEIPIQLIPHFMSSYRDRNGGGDSIETDGGLLVINYEK